MGVVAAAAGLGVAGCARVSGAVGGEAGTVSVTPLGGRPPLRLDATRAVYDYTDANTFDIYLTDLPPEAVRRLHDAGGGDGGSVEREPLEGGGQIVHLHVFLWPEAGRSPIDFDASNATITHAVIVPAATQPDRAVGEGVAAPSAPPSVSPSMPRVAIYSGGGFLLPGGVFAEPGDPWLAGRLRGGTVRFRVASPGASDALGGGAYDLRVRARLSPREADELRRALAAMDRRASRRAGGPEGDPAPSR